MNDPIRSALRFVAGLSWLVGQLWDWVSVLVALIGFTSGGFLETASRNFGGGDTPFILRIISMVPGVLVAAGGLMSVMFAQHTKATIDTNQMALLHKSPGGFIL